MYCYISMLLILLLVPHFTIVISLSRWTLSKHRLLDENEAVAEELERRKWSAW